MKTTSGIFVLLLAFPCWGEGIYTHATNSSGYALGINGRAGTNQGIGTALRGQNQGYNLGINGTRLNSGLAFQQSPLAGGQIGPATGINQRGGVVGFGGAIRSRFVPSSRFLASGRNGRGLAANERFGAQARTPLNGRTNSIDAGINNRRSIAGQIPNAGLGRNAALGPQRAGINVNPPNLLGIGRNAPGINGLGRNVTNRNFTNRNFTNRNFTNRNFTNRNFR